MGNHRWNERDSEERGGRGWRGQRQGGEAGHNPAGPAQGDYAGGGRGDEDRSWQSGQSPARPEDGYNDAGPLQRGQGDDRQRQAFGNPGYGHRGAYGDFDRQGYVGSESRTGYGNRPSRGYGGSQYGQTGGAYGEHARDWGYEGGRGDTGFGDPNAYVRAATDGQAQGSHRGKGPKDYSRSDERIRDDVNDRLTEDHHIDASNITVTAKGGEITLSGTVDSRFAKRHAEDLSDRISGVKHVQNNLRIGDGRATGEAATTDATSSATSTARGSTSFS